MSDEIYMQRALSLAERGAGHVSPNPMVGAVIVKDGKIIGEGWHEKYGGLHAERNALADCRRRGEDPAGALTDAINIYIAEYLAVKAGLETALDEE